LFTNGGCSSKVVAASAFSPPGAFKSGRHFAASLGLVPRQDGTGGKVKLAHNPTGADGTSSDPLAIANSADSNKLGTQFCNSDWVLKISAITYGVDATNPADPKLTRTQGGVTNVLAEQVIGFKVGASIWNGDTDNPYSFDATSYNHDWSLIRSVRVSIIGRGNYIQDVNNKFVNTFDQGKYKVQGISVVISPRNLSMNDI